MARTSGTQRSLDRCIFCRRTRAHKSSNDRAPRPGVLFRFVATPLNFAASSSRDRRRRFYYWITSVRLHPVGICSSSRPQLGQRLFISRSHRSHYSTQLRVDPTHLHARLHGRIALGQTRGTWRLVWTGHRTAYYIRSNPSFSAPALVFLVQSDRIYLRRPVFPLDHRSQSRNRAVSIVRLATVLSPVACGAGAFGRFRCRRARPIRCAIGHFSPVVRLAGRCHNLSRCSCD